MMARGDIGRRLGARALGFHLISTTGAKLIAEEKDLWPDKEFALTVMSPRRNSSPLIPTWSKKSSPSITIGQRGLNDDSGKYAPQLEQALLTLTGKQLKPGVAAQALARVKFTEDPSPQTFQANAQWSYDLGFSKEKQDTSGLFDLSILNKMHNAQQ